MPLNSWYQINDIRDYTKIITEEIYEIMMEMNKKKKILCIKNTKTKENTHITANMIAVK